MPKPEEDLWVVVCTELHRAIGVIAGRMTAYNIAKRMTESDTNDCVYVPVAMSVIGEVETIVAGEEEKEWRPPGQYL